MQDPRALAFAHALHISEHFTSIVTISEQVNHISQLPVLASIVSALNADVVVIDIGSNDFATQHMYAPTIAIDRARQVIHFAQSLPCHRVIIHAILPRTANISCSTRTSLDNMCVYNYTVRATCEANIKLVYHKVRGFAFRYERSNEIDRPVHEWSCDGIHCDSSSMLTYQSRLRHVILHNKHSYLCNYKCIRICACLCKGRQRHVCICFSSVTPKQIPVNAGEI